DAVPGPLRSADNRIAARELRTEYRRRAGGQGQRRAARERVEPGRARQSDHETSTASAGISFKKEQPVLPPVAQCAVVRVSGLGSVSRSGEAAHRGTGAARSTD